MTDQEKRGGSRPGAGRPQVTFRLSEEYATKLREFAASHGKEPEVILEILIQQALLQEHRYAGGRVYSIEDELAYLVERGTLPVKSILEWIEQGKMFGVNQFPQYVDWQGNASFYGILANLEPTRAYAIARDVSTHFGHDDNEATEIEKLLANVQVGDIPATSPALARIEQTIRSL